MMTGIKKINMPAVATVKFSLTAFFACVLLCAAARAQDQPSVTGIELRSGGRGLMLLISGSGPIALAGQADQIEKATVKYTDMRVKISTARSALGVNKFNPPESIPVQSITLSDMPDGIEFKLVMRGTINGPVQIRGSDNQIRILLTRDALTEVVWTSANGLVSGPAVPPGVTLAEQTKVIEQVTAQAQAQVPAQPAKVDVVIPSEGEIKTEPVDMKKLEERAVRDMQSPAEGRMFSIQTPIKAASIVPPIQTASTPLIAPPVRSSSVTKQEGAVSPAPSPAVQTPPPAPVIQTPPPIELTKSETPRADAPTRIFHDSEPGKPMPSNNLVRYKVFGRDPFVPLVKDGNAPTEMPRVENLRLVGVLEDSRERIALLEDFTNNNRAFALRVNDPVEYGKVLRVQRDRVVFLIRDFDVSRSYTLGITRDAPGGGNVRRP